MTHGLLSTDRKNIVPETETLNSKGAHVVHKSMKGETVAGLILLKRKYNLKQEKILKIKLVAHSPNFQTSMWIFKTFRFKETMTLHQAYIFCSLFS